MKVDCPYCHASSVCESTDNAAEQAVDQLSNIAVLEGAVHELCQSLSLHPLIKVFLRVTLVVATSYIKFNNESLHLAQKPYHCEDCNKFFTVFYPFV